MTGFILPKTGLAWTVSEKGRNVEARVLQRLRFIQGEEIVMRRPRRPTSRLFMQYLAAFLRDNEQQRAGLCVKSLMNAAFHGACVIPGP